MLAQKHINAVKKFLEQWGGQIEGALITGSAVTSYFSKHSDIDVYMVLPPGTKWRERGNVVVDNMLVEYLANPPEQIRKYFENEFEKNRRPAARMILMGRVVYDKGIIAELKKEAKAWFTKRFKPLDKNTIENLKYFIWDDFENLKDIYYKKFPHFELCYNNLLSRILESYAKYLCTEIPPLSKIYLFFTDPRFRKEYYYEDFPDVAFGELFLDCITLKEGSKKMQKLEKLVGYVLDKMGGFEINGYKLRSGLDL